MLKKFITQMLWSLCFLSTGLVVAEEAKGAVLQAAIAFQPAEAGSRDGLDHIQPGTGLILSVVVENKGNEPSPSGEIFVRYALAAPLNEQKGSILYESEKKSLPAIEPGHSVDLRFSTPHVTPGITDYVRYDWGLREYQAIINVKQKEQMIGSVALAYSAYYYPGIKKELPKQLGDY